MAVREWFAGQEILLTGVTSDIGNAVLEKLLRSSLGIKTIHVVLRSWNSLRKEERVKRILASAGFERVRQECPDAASRLNIVEGNLLYDDLGLTKDQSSHFKNVSVVIHAGGPLKALLDFCSKLPTLRAAAVVVSIFKERGKITESIDENKLPKIPLALVRVPAIGPALREPMPGYLSVFKGATALMVGAGYALGESSFPAAILPVDLAVNILLASAWSKGTRDEEQTVKVYNVPALDCTWSTLLEKGRRASKKFPYPSFGIRGMTSWPLLHSFIVLMLEWLPSYLCDAFLHAIGDKPRLVEEHYRIRSMLRSIEPVLSRTWLSDQNNVRKLHDQLSLKDQEEFFVRTDIDIEAYVLCSAASVKKLCINDENGKIIRIFKFSLIAGVVMLLILAVLFR